MRKVLLPLLTLFILYAPSLFAQEDSYSIRAQKYVEQFKDLAIKEQRKSGVPAAITLAQGIHESNAGISELAQNANNHFGIKCRKSWEGETYTYTDDAPDECFRKYRHAEESYLDHSDYLRTSQRYASLFDLSPTDYTAWAYGLKRAGYATNPKYAKILINLIEEYQLQEYTYTAMKNKPGKGENYASNTISRKREIVPEQDADFPKPLQEKKRLEVPESYTYGQEIKINGLRAFYAKKGTVLLDQAFKYDIRYARLLELNDLPDAPLEEDMFIYLEKKSTRAKNTAHIVNPGETMLQIAQKEGIQLNYLLMWNRMNKNEEAIVGSMLQLQTMADAKPTVIPKSAIKKESAQPELSITARASDDFIAKSEISDSRKAAPIVKETREVKIIEPVKTIKPRKEELVKAEPQNIEKMDPVFIPKPEEAITTKEEPVAGRPVNIADETSAEEEKLMKQPEEPQDEFSRLKAKLDKVVYAEENKETKIVSKENPPPPVKDKDPAKYYTVKKGDTAFSIAKDHKITVSQLREWNQLDFESIKVGMQLKVKR